MQAPQIEALPGMTPSGFNKYPMKIVKGFHDWKATTDYILGEVEKTDMHPAGQRILRLYTMKGSSGNITSTASVHIRAEHNTLGYSEHSLLTFGAGGGDFHKRIASVTARATEKTVTECHKVAALQFDALIDEARKYYEGK